MVATAQEAIQAMHLHDTPEKLEWLTGHFLDQADVNARLEWHRDSDMRNETGGHCQRRVLYSVMAKLNSGGCTSVQVCGQQEVYYLPPGGSGVIFRADLHHRTEKAEPGVWKMALLFGVPR